jgi:hypothetical protein
LNKTEIMPLANNRAEGALRFPAYNKDIRGRAALLRSRISPIAILLLLIPLTLATGCHKDQVQVYRVADNQDQSQPAAAPNLPPAQAAMASANNMSLPMASGMVPSDVQNAGALTWTTPAGWTQVPPSEMRVASFKISGPNGASGDVSVVPLSGMAGGDFANVNRWRGQLGLPDAPDDQLQNSAENVDAGGQPAQLFDIAGQNPHSRIIAAIQHREGTTWFFKMTGDATLLEQQKSAFEGFLKSISFNSSQASTGVSDMSSQSQQTLPPGHPDINGMTPPEPSGPISHDGQPAWQIPAGWQEVSAGQFLVGKFAINGDNGATAAVNVSSSSGDGGGLLANVNRWRGQLGLPPETEVSTTDFQVNGGQAQLMDMTGTDAETSQPSEIIGIMVSQNDRTWFYKLMGDPKLVAAQKDAFTKFVQGVQY